MFKNKLFVFVVATMAIVISVGFYFGINGDDRDRLGTSSYVGIAPDPQTDNPGWTTGANMPTYSYHAGNFDFVRNDTGWVYCVGGDLTGSGTISQKNDRYNVRTNTWTTMLQYPTPPGIWYSDGATLGTNGYICGGLTGGSLSNCTAQLTRYDINANTWTIMAPMPQPRAMGQVEGYQDSLLYYIAGFNNGGSGAGTTDVFLYNSNSNTWRTATPLPQARIGGGMAIAGDTIVWVSGVTPGFIGGSINYTPYRGVISQSNRANITWTTGTNYPGTGGYRNQVQYWSCRGIISSGGANTATYTGATTDCYVYSPGANVWTIQPPLITSRTAHMSGSVQLANNIWKFVNVCGFNGANVLTTNIMTDTLACGPPPAIQNTFCRNGLNITLPDNSLIKDSVNVLLGAACSVTDVNVRIDTFFHTWDADVRFYIQKANVGVLIVNHVGGSGDNFIGTKLDDSATTPIANGTAPFTGTFKPSNPLTPFNGINPGGYWRLVATDSAFGDTGLLKAWCVQICYINCTGVQQTLEIPNYYFLNQNYPNPFNPVTTIKFGLPEGEQVRLVVYDILGREVKTLINEYRSQGVQEVTFDASNFASGVYFYRIEAGKFTAVKKMLLVK